MEERRHQPHHALSPHLSTGEGFSVAVLIDGGRKRRKSEPPFLEGAEEGVRIEEVRGQDTTEEGLTGDSRKRKIGGEVGGADLVVTSGSGGEVAMSIVQGLGVRMDSNSSMIVDTAIQPQIDAMDGVITRGTGETVPQLLPAVSGKRTETRPRGISKPKVPRQLQPASRSPSLISTLVVSEGSASDQCGEGNEKTVPVPMMTTTVLSVTETTKAAASAVTTTTIAGTEANPALIDGSSSSVPPAGTLAEGELPRCRWSTCTSVFRKTEDLLPHISRYHLAAHRLSATTATSIPTKPSQIPAPQPEHNDGDSEDLSAPPDPTPPTSSAPPLPPETLQPEGQAVREEGRKSLEVEYDTPTVHQVAVTCHWAECEKESDGFRSIEDLVRHLSSAHLSRVGEAVEKPHACLWRGCENRYKKFEDLTDHIASDHITRGQSQYVCEWRGCSRGGRPFTQRQKIIRHVQTHTGDKPYECTVCNQRFSDQNILPQHMRTHTGERPYRCEDPSCGKEFAILGALKIHMRLHTGEKPFACKQEGCDKRFAESSNLTKHLRVHTGEKPFQCVVALCGKKFARPDQVSRHAKTHLKKQAGSESSGASTQ
ncbi:zinc-finger protein [Dinochytrium kinnereticum]|nr:zinc-finger protein [Dinochytrium kinnereticum]